MSNSSIAVQLELKKDFEKSGPDSKVTDECMQEIISRLQISAVVPEAFNPNVCVSSDTDNLLTTNSEGCLRVQKDTFHLEEQSIPVPGTSTSSGDRYLVGLNRYCIDSVILSTGQVVNIPNNGKTPDPENEGEFLYPADFEELAENLNDETTQFTFAVEDGAFIITSVLSESISAVIERGDSDSSEREYLPVEPIIEAQAGNSTVTFKEGAISAGIDYASQLFVIAEFYPQDGYSRAYRTRLRSDEVVFVVEGVTKALTASLKVFTPASREDKTEF